jgi:hypothetical protein
VCRSVPQLPACHASARTPGEGKHAALRILSQLHPAEKLWQLLCGLTLPSDVIAFLGFIHSSIHSLIYLFIYVNTLSATQNNMKQKE